MEVANGFQQARLRKQKDAKLRRSDRKVCQAEASIRVTSRTTQWYFTNGRMN